MHALQRRADCLCHDAIGIQDSIPSLETQLHAGFAAEQRRVALHDLVDLLRLRIEWILRAREHLCCETGLVVVENCSAARLATP